MNIIEEASRKTVLFFGTTPATSEHIHHAIAPGLAPLVLALGAGVFTAYLAGETGRAILSELRRRRRLREKLPVSPSLRGSPTPGELEELGAVTPRTLAVRLRLGSRLADLEPTLDARIESRELANGQKRIKTRAPGLKGWLADRRVSLNYSTLVRYKKLAQRLRQMLALDDRLPLEWLLPGEDLPQPVPSDLVAQYAAAKRRMRTLLRTHRNFSRLSRHVEAELGIPQLLAVRRARVRDRRGRRAERQRKDFTRRTTAARARYGPLTVKATPDRLEATKREFLRFLGERDLPPPLLHLRNKALHWLGTFGA